MKTITWKDAAYTREAGTVRLPHGAVEVEESHVARWMDDPEGRFAIVAPRGESAPARLEKFYPSL